MQLVKGTTVIRLADPAEPWIDMRNLLRAAGAEQAEIQAPPLSVEDASKKRRVTLQIRAVIVEQEGIDSVDRLTSDTSAVLKALHQASPFPALQTIRHDLIFLEPMAVPFHELNALLKDRFLQPSPFVEKASDMSVILDSHDDGTLKHLQLGPMDVAQIKRDFLRWPSDAIPETFVFVSLSFQKQISNGYSQDLVDDFFQTATRWQNSEAQSLVEFLRG